MGPGRARESASRLYKQGSRQQRVTSMRYINIRSPRGGWLMPGAWKGTLVFMVSAQASTVGLFATASPTLPHTLCVSDTHRVLSATYVPRLAPGPLGCRGRSEQQEHVRHVLDVSWNAFAPGRDAPGVPPSLIRASVRPAPYDSRSALGAAWTAAGPDNTCRRTGGGGGTFW